MTKKGKLSNKEEGKQYCRIIEEINLILTLL